jgi:hypothetical protein
MLIRDVNRKNPNLHCDVCASVIPIGAKCEVLVDMCGWAMSAKCDDCAGKLGGRPKKD